MEEEFALDQEALGMEEQKNFSPYRVNEDLSYKLDIPRDVKGLVKLLEERKKIEKPLKEVEKEKYPTSFFLPGLVYSATVAAVLVEAYYNHPLTVAITTLIVGGSTIIGLTYYLREKSPAIKKFNQEKIQKLQELQSKIQSLDQKISYYEKHYILNDVVLIRNSQADYSLGHVIANNKNELIVRRTYHEKIYDSDVIDGRYWAKCSEERSFHEKDIVSILQPSVQLSADDLRSVDEKTPILCRSAESSNKSSDFGFLEKHHEEGYFMLRTFYVPAGPGESGFKYDQIEKGEINAFLLVPEIKPRIL